MVLLGMLPVPALAAAVESLTYDIVRAGSNPLLITMVKQFNNDGVMSFYNIVDIPGVVLGPALIGLALWRARAVPIWSAVLITFSRLVVFLFPFFPSLPGVYLQFPSCLLLLVGSIPAARAVLRTLSEERQSTPNKEAHFPGATLSEARSYHHNLLRSNKGKRGLCMLTDNHQTLNVPLISRLLIASGAIDPILFILVFLVEGATRPGYSAWHNFVSDLSLSNHGWMQIANFLIW